jgi:hypothetical protein
MNAGGIDKHPTTPKPSMGAREKRFDPVLEQWIWNECDGSGSTAVEMGWI